MQNRILAIFIFILCFIFENAFASQRYWVNFIDKGHYQQLPAEKQIQAIDEILSTHARERRAKRSVLQFTKENLVRDLPLEEEYIRQLIQLGFSLHGKSRWLNAVSGSATDSVLRKIRQLPFVRTVEPVKTFHFREAAIDQEAPSRFPRRLFQDSLAYDYGNSEFQITFHEIDKLHRLRLTGKGVIVAMFDTGFSLDNPSIQHVALQLLAEHDFVQGDSITSNQPGDAPSQQNHGTLTLSVLGGFLPGTLIGPAFDATFILAKTEKVDSETHLEEDNWAMAAEWAEAKGADIVSSSLGYFTFDPGQTSYTYQDINGETTIVTKAANELTRRGVVVVNSAGNEGNDAWHYIIAPADGFNVIAVGALNSMGKDALFSSRGPTFDGRIKPDVSALGIGVFGAGPGNSFGTASGTSLSCPIVAGVAALLLQQNPNLSVQGMISVLRNSADNHENPNNDIGWGKINAREALYLAKPEFFSGTLPHPNPWIRGQGVVFIPVHLTEPSGMRLTIYNVLGQQVFQQSEYGSSENNLVSWNGRDQHGHLVPAGVYVFQVSTNSGTNYGKIIIL
jgi:serine protease AprX